MVNNEIEIKINGEVLSRFIALGLLQVKQCLDEGSNIGKLFLYAAPVSVRKKKKAPIRVSTHRNFSN